VVQAVIYKGGIGFAAIPGMNAIAFTREVRAISCAPRRMAARTTLNNILRGSPKTASTYGRTLRVRPGDDVRDSFTGSQEDVALCGNHHVDFIAGANHSILCPAPSRKIFRFVFYPNQLRIPCVPPDERGVAHVTKRAGRMRWTRGLRKTNASARVRQSRVVLTPRWLVSSSQGAHACSSVFLGATVTNKLWSRRGEHEDKP
jgi:hypothetical protein